MEKDRGYLRVISHRVEFPEDIKVIDNEVLNGLMNDYGLSVEHLYTDVSEIYIPSTVRLITEAAFNGFEGLERVIIPKNNNLQYIGHSAFKNCRDLKHFDFGFCTQLRLVDQFAFMNTQITEKQLADIPNREFVYYGKEVVGELNF